MADRQNRKRKKISAVLAAAAIAMSLAVQGCASEEQKVSDASAAQTEAADASAEDRAENALETAQAEGQAHSAADDETVSGDEELPELVWSIGDETVAMVQTSAEDSGRALLTGLSQGIAVVRVKTPDGTILAEYTVTVTEADLPADSEAEENDASGEPAAQNAAADGIAGLQTETAAEAAETE